MSLQETRWVCTRTAGIAFAVHRGGKCPCLTVPSPEPPQVPPNPCTGPSLTPSWSNVIITTAGICPLPRAPASTRAGDRDPLPTPQGMMLSSVQVSLFTPPAPLLGFYRLPFLALKSLCKGIFNSPGHLQHRGMSVPWWMIPSPHQKPVAVVQNQLNWGVMVLGCEQCLSQPQSHSQHLGSTVPASHYHSSPTRGSAQIPGGSSPPQTDGTGHAVSSRISSRAGRSCWHSGRKPDDVPLQRGNVKLCHTEQVLWL